MRLEPIKTKYTATAGEWDRQADCFPAPGSFRHGTFSIGIFQWVPATNGMKKAKAAQRMRGSVSDAQKVLDMANARVAELNAFCANVLDQPAAGLKQP